MNIDVFLNDLTVVIYVYSTLLLSSPVMCDGFAKIKV